MDLHRLPLSDAHSPVRNGVLGRCPRCGQGHLFSGLLALAPRCDVCGLDYGFADPADGPAFFVMSIVSFVIVPVLFVLQMTFSMPEWALVGLGTALIGGLSIGLLIPFKGWLVCSQYFYKAGEGVLAGPVSAAPCGCASCRARAAKRVG